MRECSQGNCFGNGPQLRDLGEEPVKERGIQEVRESKSTMSLNICDVGIEKKKKRIVGNNQVKYNKDLEV